MIDPDTESVEVGSVEVGPVEVGSARDPAFLRAARPVLELFASYFRPEVRGFERLPDKGPFLVVGNHSGGQIPPDLPVLLTAWWRRRGEDERAIFPPRNESPGHCRCGSIPARSSTAWSRHSSSYPAR